MLKEREAGRIRNLGFSYHGDIKAFDYLLSRHDEFRWDFVQIQLNYVDYRHASGMNFNADYLYAELDKRNIPVVVMEPLLGGRLAGLTDYLNARLKQRRPQESIASWAFRFAASFPRVLTVLSGMTYMEHLQDNIRTFAPLDVCTDEELALLEDTAQTMLKYPSVPCTACQYCMPCPYGLDIPGIFAHYNKCINEGNVPSSSQNENYRKARRAFLIGYDRSVPRLRQANHCIGCNQCVHHCPQNIDIPAQMQRIDHFVEQAQTRDFIMERLIRLLHEGGHSLVVGNDTVPHLRRPGHIRSVPPPDGGFRSTREHPLPTRWWVKARRHLWCWAACGKCMPESSALRPQPVPRERYNRPYGTGSAQHRQPCGRRRLSGGTTLSAVYDRCRVSAVDKRIRNGTQATKSVMKKQIKYTEYHADNYRKTSFIRV